MGGLVSWLDPKWRYRPACATDVRKTIARERKRLKAEAALKVVVPLKKKGAK
jgi:hypothetical protein